MAFSQTQVPVARKLSIRADGDGWIRLSHNLHAFVDPARAADTDPVSDALRARAVPAPARGDEGRGGDHGPDVHWWGGVRSADMLFLLNGLGGRLRSTYLGRGARGSCVRGMLGVSYPRGGRREDGSDCRDVAMPMYIYGGVSAPFGMHL